MRIALRSRDGIYDCIDVHAYISMYALATRSLHGAIDGTRTGVVYRFMMHPCARACVRVRFCDWARTHPRGHMRARSVGVDRGWLGSQVFNNAAAFNANIGAWNVLRVTTYANEFHSAGLADCIKRAVYDNWGSTLQTAYPTWSSLSVCATAITNANIGTAVTAWLTDPTTATTTYGPIADWDTAAVTTMASLFYPSGTAQPTFNADISKWNVASVSNMCQVHLASVWTAYSFIHVLSMS
jgi:hypothetical protein